MDHVIALRQISVTAQCYSSILFRRLQGDPSLKKRREWRSVPVRADGGPRGAVQRESERARACLAPPFMCFLPPGAALCKLGSARGAVLPEVLTPVLGPFFDLPLFYFCRLFPSLCFSHCHSGLLFPILTT